MSDSAENQSLTTPVEPTLTGSSFSNVPSTSSTSSNPTSCSSPSSPLLLLETKLHAINPSSVKCQCKASSESGQTGTGMITVSGDIAKRLQALPLGTTIRFQIDEKK